MSQSVQRVAIIDYGMGNLRSIAKAIEYVAPQAQVLITHDPKQVANAHRIVVPGQGAMPDCMTELRERQLVAAVLQSAREKPFLGICIGLQMLFEKSAEGAAAGLGIYPGQVWRFPNALIERGYKVPHMGWNEVHQVKPHSLWTGIADQARFYFVHSYRVDYPTAGAVGSTDYGEPFTSAIAHGNVFAVQFHPEKSAKDGLRFLTNFMAWNPDSIAE